MLIILIRKWSKLNLNQLKQRKRFINSYKWKAQRRQLFRCGWILGFKQCHRVSVSSSFSSASSVSMSFSDRYSHGGKGDCHSSGLYINCLVTSGEKELLLWWVWWKMQNKLLFDLGWVMDPSYGARTGADYPDCLRYPHEEKNILPKEWKRNIRPAKLMEVSTNAQFHHLWTMPPLSVGEMLLCCLHTGSALSLFCMTGATATSSSLKER